jgi:hypothetical protein
MAHGGHSRPDVAVLCCLCALWCWRARRSRLEIGIDVITVHQPTLWRPVTIPRSAITTAAAGAPADIGRPTTVPPRLSDVPTANVVLELTAPIVVRNFPSRRQRSIDTVALIAVDVDQAAAALARLGLPAPSALPGR